MKKLVSLYHRRASTSAVRASSNRLARLAARGGLPTANDLATAHEQIAAVAPFFDAGFYPSWYGITADPVRDYLVHGWREGRDPRPNFSSATDLPYLVRAGINPFRHLLANQRPRKGPVGGRVGEEGNAVLASPTRLTRRRAVLPRGNYDLAAADVDPVDHHMASGWREGRKPSPPFDTLLDQRALT
ncbi:hypothetical protein [Methylobacterium sp. CM6246]